MKKKKTNQLGYKMTNGFSWNFHQPLTGRSLKCFHTQKG
jgi:hypothetical protein